MARRRHKINIQPGNNQHFTAHLNPDAFPWGRQLAGFVRFFSFVFCRQYAIVTFLRYETGRKIELSVAERWFPAGPSLGQNSLI